MTLAEPKASICAIPSTIGIAKALSPKGRRLVPFPFHDNELSR
jgi:hypothetical protein